MFGLLFFWLNLLHANPQEAFDKLKGVPLVTLEVMKTTKSELMGTETKTKGKIYLATGKFRWDTEGNEQSSIIFDGTTVWTVQQPPKGFKIPPQITKMKLNAQSEHQIFLRSLFNENLKSQFTIDNSEKEKNKTRYYLKPTKKNQATNALEIVVGNALSLVEISYKDEVENTIKVEIGKIIKSSKIPKGLFQYKPPRGAQVSEL